MSITLVLADDHPLVLNGLTNLLKLEDDFEVLASCTNGLEALEAIQKHKPNVAVLDIRMPGMNGLDLARKISEEGGCTRFVILTAAMDDAELLDAVQLGIHGIVLKEMMPHLLLQCIRKVHAGEHWVERRTAKYALEKLLKREAGARDMAATLSKREIELVKMVVSGLRNKQIAEKLFISEGTVKVHLHNIYEKLKLDGRMGLLRYAQEKGLA